MAFQHPPGDLRPFSALASPIKESALSRLPRLTWPLAAVLTVAATASHAQNTATEQHLNEIVVTASGYEQQIKDAPASISVITREQLSKGSYSNLHDALRDVPGVILTPSDNNSNDISLRGMGAAYTLILVDGKRMSTRETQTNGSTGTDQSWVPPLEAIERIEVVRGPMSTLYGSDAMGGVINIITRKVAKEWHGSVRLESTLQERSESGNAYQTNFYVSGPLVADTLGLSVYGNVSKRDEDKILSGFNKHGNESVNVKLAFTPNKDHDIIAELGASKQNYISTPGRTGLATAAISDRDSERDNFSLQHKGRWGWATSDTHIQQEEVKNISRQMTIENTVFNSNWTVPLGERHLLNTGVYYNQNNLTDLTTNRLPGATRTTADRKQYAYYLEDEWRITDDFALTGGLRYDHDSQAGGNVSPRLYGVWSVAPQWTVKGGYSTGFKAPSLRQTLGDWGASSRGGDMYGNPDLAPEKSATKELGVIFDSGAGTVAGLTVFDNVFEDKITRVACPTCGPLNSSGREPTTYVNVDDAITRGVEATLKTPLTQTLNLSANYTFTKSEQKSGEFAGSPLNQLPRHLFNLGLDWDASSKLNAWTKLSYRGEESVPTSGASSGNFIQKSYSLLDIGGSYKYSKSITFMAGIYNLLDKEVLDDKVNYDHVEDGRRLWLAMNAKF